MTDCPHTMKARTRDGELVCCDCGRDLTKARRNGNALENALWRINELENQVTALKNELDVAKDERLADENKALHNIEIAECRKRLGDATDRIDELEKALALYLHQTACLSHTPRSAITEARAALTGNYDGLRGIRG